jgi:hypothetical protein
MKKSTENLALPSSLTLRDYFAAQILPTTYQIVYEMIKTGGIEYDNEKEPDTHEIIATLKAYEVADYMMTARACDVWADERKKRKNDSE